MSILELYLKYHQMRSSSSVDYATHLCIQQIGHTLGRNSINRMKPRAVRHNTYVALLGQSGKSMKTTAQEDVSTPTIPERFKGTKTFSPEGLLRNLEEQPHLICPLGEFSTALRGIKMGGHMSNFKEISNDLWSCPDVYDKRLAKKEDSYCVKNCYLSMSTTCTEEEFFPNLKPDMVNGGFIPRWILVHSPPMKKSREPLPENIDAIERIILVIFNEMYKYFQKHPAVFELTPEAYEKYYDIVEKLEEDEGEFSNVQPFVARYQRYIVAYADILLVSDLIGEELSKLSDLTKINKLSKLNELSKLKNDIQRISQTTLLTSLKSVKSVNSVTPPYIYRAYKLLKPCLNYAKKAESFVDEDFYVAKVKTQIDKIGNKVTRSYLLQRSGLLTDTFQKVLNTLYKRGEIKVIEETKGEGRRKKTTQYIMKTDKYV